MEESDWGDEVADSELLLAASEIEFSALGQGGGEAIDQGVAIDQGGAVDQCGAVNQGRGDAVDQGDVSVAHVKPASELEAEDEDGEDDSSQIISASFLLEARHGENPLMSIRGGYLWVSDFVSQSWCEYQMVYKLTGAAFMVGLPERVEEQPFITIGSNLHLARELAVHDVVKVHTTSDVDIFAVKVINLISSVQQLLGGSTVCREVPIFGAPLGGGVFFMGIIDELRYDPDTMQVELVEFKTRKHNSLPSMPQRMSHHVQVLLYKELFDELVKGRLSKLFIAETFHFDLKETFGDDVMKRSTVLGTDDHECRNLDSLFDCLFHQIQHLTCINSVLIEYCYQGNQTTIGFDQVVHDDNWFADKFSYFLDFWLGKREVSGVDIEDAWKCHNCDYKNICLWRHQKSEQCKNDNLANRNT